MLYPQKLAGNGRIFYCPGLNAKNSVIGSRYYEPLLTSTMAQNDGNNPGSVRYSYIYNPWVVNPAGTGKEDLTRFYQKKSQVKRKVFGMDFVDSEAWLPGGDVHINGGNFAHSRSKGWNVLFTDASVEFKKVNAKSRPFTRWADLITANTTSKASVIWRGWSLSSLAVPRLAAATLSAAELRDEWIDADTGHRVVRLSRVPGESQSLYFHQNEFTASGDKLVFENGDADAPRGERGMRANRIYSYDFTRQQCGLLTDQGGKVILVAARSRQVYHQRSNTLFVTHLDTRKTTQVSELPFRWRVSAINSDETFGAGTFVSGGPQIDTSGPKSSWFDKVFEAARPGGIFLVDLKTGETRVIRRGTNWFNHLQFSPTDPALLQYCHEGPWHKLDRIWHIRTDGSGLRLMHARTMPMEIAGHEFWSSDGKTVWFDLQVPRGENFFLAGVEVGSGKETRYPIERDQWSVHYNISWDGKLFAGDGGAPNMVAKATDGKWIYLFTPQPNGTLKCERLVNMAKHDYDLEPNVQFTPDGKWIVFRANFDGPSQVYAVEVAKASGAAAPRERENLSQVRLQPERLRARRLPLAFKSAS